MHPLDSKKAASNPGEPGRNSRGVLLALLFCGILLIGSWLWFAHYFLAKTRTSVATEKANKSDRTFACAPGPWGDLECTRVTIELPDHFIDDQLLTLEPTSWFFGNYSREQVVALFETAGLDAMQHKALIEEGEWLERKDGTKVLPPEKVVLSLSPRSRAKIFSVLELFPANQFHHAPFVFRADRLAERFEYSGLRPETIRLFHQMTYPRNSNIVLFSDSETLMRQIPGRNERLHTVKTLSRRNTLLVKLKITPETNVEELLQFWGQGGRAKDLRPLLQSLAKVPEGCKIDIAHLLPPFARQRVYTYPYPSEKEDQAENCHWTALNFFQDTPDPQFLKANVVEQVIREDYVPVTGDWRMGDVIFLVNSASVLIHSAVYIADDIIFTKNGVNPSHPWVYMQMDDMLLYYESPGNPLEKWTYRRKDFLQDAE